MADNLHPALASRSALSDHVVVSFEGPDALAFAHAQFANDVLALAVGQWQWNAWLTPKGRVIALFALLRRDENSLWVVLPDYPADEFVQQLQRFVFRRKLKITRRDDLAVFGLWGQGFAQTGGWGERDGGVEIDRGSSAGPRFWRIAPVGAPVEGQIIASPQWRLHDIRDGIPRLDAAQREQWTPQQLSLDRLQAYSVKKGCYPGQEIVARTHFLGKAKRALRLLRAPAQVAEGDRVSSDGKDVGEVVSVAIDDGFAWALAVLPLEDAWDSLSIADVTVGEAPLGTDVSR